MQKVLFQWGRAPAALLALLTTAPLQAADNSGVRPVAEQLGQRAAATVTPEAQQKSGTTHGFGEGDWALDASSLSASSRSARVALA